MSILNVTEMLHPICYRIATLPAGGLFHVPGAASEMLLFMFFCFLPALSAPYHKGGCSMAIEMMFCLLDPGLIYFFCVIGAVSHDGIVFRIAEDKLMITKRVGDSCLTNPDVQVHHSFLVNYPQSFYAETDTVLSAEISYFTKVHLPIFNDLFAVRFYDFHKSAKCSFRYF